MKLTRPESIIICISAIICAAIAIALVVEEILREHKSKTTHNYLNSTDMTLPRGYRNNNPLNIRNSNEKWAGEIRPSQDPAFKQFKSMGYGFRAALKLIRNYIGKGHNSCFKRNLFSGQSARISASVISRDHQPGRPGQTDRNSLRDGDQRKRTST